MFVANTWYNFMAQVHNTKMAPVPQVQNTKMAPVHWLSRHFQGQGISMLVWTSNFPLFSILPSECTVGHWLSRHFRSSRAFQCLCGHLFPRYFLSISNHGFLMLKRTSNFPLCSIVRLDANHEQKCLYHRFVYIICCYLMILLPWIKVWRTYTRRGILGKIMFLPGHSPIPLDTVTIFYIITIHSGLFLG